MIRKNILFIRSDLRVAGPAVLMHKCAMSLRDLGYNVIFLSGGGEYCEKIEDDGFLSEVHGSLRVGERDFAGTIQCLLLIRSLVDKHEIDLIHSFNLLSGLWCSVATLFTGVKMVNTVLGYGRESWFPLFRGDLIAVSEFTKSQIYELSSWKKEVFVVHNSTIDESFFVEEPASRRADCFEICCVAMMAGNKGQRKAIAAVSRLREKIPGVRLTLVGDGAGREECEELVSELEMTEIVNFEGRVFDVRPALRRANLFLHLTQQETFGIAIAEAMASGLPVVASRVGGIPEVVEDGVTGILVDRNDEDEVDSALMRVYEDPDFAREMGIRGIEKCRSEFTLPQLGKNLNSVYSAIWDETRF